MNFSYVMSGFYPNM